VWYASNLKRTPPNRRRHPGRGLSQTLQNCSNSEAASFAEQHLGEWQGLNRAAFMCEPGRHRGWAANLVCARIYDPAPGRRKLYGPLRQPRTRCDRAHHTEHAGKDVIAVGHGGTIKAAIGLGARQPAGQKASPLPSTIATVTRSITLTSDGHQGWRVPMVNQQPVDRRMPRITPCISRPDRKSPPPATGLRSTLSHH